MDNENEKPPPFWYHKLMGIEIAPPVNVPAYDCSKPVESISLEDEYKKDTGVTPEAIKELREWLDTQPHLPKDHITDLELILAHHFSDCDLEKSKQVIDHHYTLRTLLPTFFEDRRFEDVEDIMNTVLLQPLPSRAKEGEAVYYCRLLDFDPAKFDFAKMLKAFLMVLDLWQYEEGTWSGIIIIFDMHGMTEEYVDKFDVPTIQQFLCYLQEACLVKIVHIDFLNGPEFFPRIHKKFAPYCTLAVPPGSFSLWAVHQIGATSIGATVRLEIFPKGVYYGTYLSLEECKDQLLSRLRTNPDFFTQEAKKRVDESLRPGKPVTLDDVLVKDKIMPKPETV
ncbi:uncharacterized protein LOC142981900 [Anticarsia gemmatalis]|uniref:uncharacterized protein LOC142981900 n=1 Tax=Anticarsia gemmatalis TaxID=129554 RepID=UPI003F7693F2